jgi:hypothetical protein
MYYTIEMRILQIKLFAVIPSRKFAFWFLLVFA